MIVCPSDRLLFCQITYKRIVLFNIANKFFYSNNLGSNAAKIKAFGHMLVTTAKEVSSRGQN